MARKVLKTKYPDRFYNIVLRVKGSQKNSIISAAREHKMSLSEFILYATWLFIREGKGIPSPGPAQYAKTTPSDVLRSYLSGETVLTPCGKKECNMILETISGMEFCNTCNIRVS